MAARRIWTDEGLREAVRTSSTVAEVIRKLGLVISGGIYPRLKGHIDRLGLSTDHFTGQGWAKGLRGNKKPLAEYLVRGRSCHTHNLKLRLIAEGVKKAKCEWCGITRWRGQPAPLELDHINGEREDNRLKNLRVLCPNCHAQTDNYRAKKLKRQ